MTNLRVRGAVHVGPAATVPSSPLSLDRAGGAATVAAFAVVLFVVLFWRLGAATFWDPDEAHYAETSRELIVSGDWLAPYYNERPFFDKPILFHWLQGASMAVIGPTEFAARLVPAFAALALIGITAWIGFRLMSADVAIISALLLATNPATFALARYAILDTVFTAFLFGGVALVCVSALQQRPRLQWVGYFLIAMAVFTKGPLAFVLCGVAFGVAIALSLVCSSDLHRRLLRLRLISGFLLATVVAAPWFVYMWFRFGDSFVSGYLLDENIRLYATDRFTPTESTSFWFYFRVLAAGLLPWTPLVVGRLIDDLRAAFRRDRSLDGIDILLWGWTFAVVMFFSLSRFKLDHYVFPAAPTLCLIGARAWVAVQQGPEESRNAGARVGLWLIGPLMVVLAVVGGYLLVARLELAAATLIIPIAIGVAGGALLIQSTRGRRAPAIPWVVIGALTMTYGGLIGWVIPEFERKKVVPDVARYVAAHATASDQVATYRLNRWNTAFRFYADRHVAMIDAPDEARRLLTGTVPFYCTMLQSSYEEFVAAGLPLRIVYQREGMWATSGRALWRGQPSLARFVVVTRAP
jgi:4-amino-4-deoxy-L-arabinose transferase-like glycosyltransferase